MEFTYSNSHAFPSLISSSSLSSFLVLEKELKFGSVAKREGGKEEICLRI